MKKLLLAIAPALILLGAGCSKTPKITISADDLTKNNRQTPAAGNEAECSAIQTADGKPIFNNADATALFGGTWTGEVTVSERGLGLGGCIYSLSADYKEGVDTRMIYIETQRKYDFDRLVNERNIKPPEFIEIEINGKKEQIKTPVVTYKDAPNLGDQALFVFSGNKTTSPELYVKKDNKYFVVSPSLSTEGQAISIAKTIISRWK